MNSRRPPQLIRIRTEMSDRDWTILRSVDELRFVSGQHLQTLHFDGYHATTDSAARTARRVLTRLTDLGVLRRLERRVGGIRAGSAGYVYCCGPNGFRLLGSEQRARRGFREPSAAFLAHTLAIAGLLAHVVRRSQEGDTQLVRYQAEPACWRSFEMYGESQTLRPDLHLVLARGDAEWHWFVEVDLGTEHAPHLRAKCHQYTNYWAAGSEQAQEGVFPKVAWLTTTSARAVRLSEVIKGVDTPELFEVGQLSDAMAVLLPDEGVR